MVAPLQYMYFLHTRGEPMYLHHVEKTQGRHFNTATYPAAPYIYIYWATSSLLTK